MHPASLCKWIGIDVDEKDIGRGIIGENTPPEDRYQIARDLKQSVKSRFEEDAWQRVAQPIFDRLRQRQRDALVSYVMHLRGFGQLEELYGEFLMDPGMEPVVQTSRIRLAIASVQLFIQRCLLNLETEVHPSTINSKHWEWMKRYRVWEANRKIFLFPENWLEPEFRDDKTHLFTELEGALLQGDVSNDLAEDAFFNYLKKLEELARLDIVTMYIEDELDPSPRTLHVFGRTFSEPHKYFYRRFSDLGWTPWEPVGADIEGDHLAPVVWRDRLYLFWVTFMAKPVMKTESVQVGPDVTTDISPPKVNVEVQLHWSDYINGQWSSRVSHGYSAPPPIIAKDQPQFEDAERNSVSIHVSKDYDTQTGEEGGVYIHLGGIFSKSFYLAGRNSVPERRAYGTALENPYRDSAKKIVVSRYETNTPKTAFNVTYAKRIAPIEESDLATKLLEKSYNIDAKEICGRYENTVFVKLNEKFDVPDNITFGIEIEITSIIPPKWEINLKRIELDGHRCAFYKKLAGKSDLFFSVITHVPPGTHEIVAILNFSSEIDLPLSVRDIIIGTVNLTISICKIEEPHTVNILNKTNNYIITPCINNYRSNLSNELYDISFDIDPVEATILSECDDVLVLQKPLFYQDGGHQHTFFVESSVTEQTVEDWQTWVTQPPQPDNMWHYQDNTLVAATPWDDSTHHAEAPFIGSADTPESLEKPKPEIDWLLNPSTVLLFDNVPIGPRGRAGIELFPHTLPGVTSQVGVAGGTGLSRGTALVVQDDITFEQSGLEPTTLGVNVVGSSGSIPSLEANLNELNIQSQQGAGTGLGRGIRRIL